MAHFIFFQSRYATLINGMKTLILIFGLLLLAGCASPYYPVYVSSEGDYYIAERNTNGPYYGTGDLLSDDIGVYPWWSGGYPIDVFAYYSPFFYPHYFSVWYPPGYNPFYGYYGGYYSYWCPPYQIRRSGRHYGNRYASTGSKGSPVMPPVSTGAVVAANPEIWRAIDRAAVKREILNRGGVGWKTGPSARPLPAYSRSSTSFPKSGLSLTPTTSGSRVSTRSTSTGRRAAVSDRTPARHEQ